MVWNERIIMKTCRSVYVFHLGNYSTYSDEGRAIAQAVSRWLPTAAARVKWDLWWIEWRWGRFLPSTSVSPAIFIPSIAPQSPSHIIWGWYNRPEVAAVQGT
jgi:hypothetical protein